MRFMNEFDIDRARDRYRNLPVLGAAVETLDNLVECANRTSDGWAYWPKPCRAAAKLMALIEGDGLDPNEVRFGRRPDATLAQLKAAYSPIKSFCTRTGRSITFVMPAKEVS